MFFTQLYIQWQYKYLHIHKEEAWVKFEISEILFRSLDYNRGLCHQEISWFQFDSRVGIPIMTTE